MKDPRLEELTTGMIEQFRIVKAREGNLEEELKIADSLANMMGKVLKAYSVELAYKEMEQKGGA